ncbi:MBL fold metallo-hydrolase [Rhizobium sp. L1K21]|uniref:MBL fold metallo-hydrolase n=1 Tax=Rhizobium sp. L1K21 TaxID=2954933 RepID=UPI002092BCC0|nr:MBL fold metallo-hydrolase [Rhizobium sp. L1K21]MCO6185405.1 MBL fold metallo-hydrolase [Rhizobium sp. L1K21]
MQLTRRGTLKLGAAGLIGLQASIIMPFAARAAGGDTYAVEGGEVVVHPVQHASFVMETPSMVIYNDPVGGAALYENMPKPDLVLITHEHSDHYNVETLNAIVGENTKLVTNPAVYDMLPEDLKAKATAIANGESATVKGMSIDAIAAYNTTEERLQYHPKGRDNGYILTIGGKRFYIAGDTEDTAEMRALEDIYVAFVPMNLPYTMDVEQASAGVAAFAPEYVYPYHYKGSDIDAFAKMVTDAGVETNVVKGPWYG